MRNIDDEIRFHLSQNGWYLGDTEIEITDDSLDVEVVIGELDSRSLAYYQRGKIYLSRAFASYASLPQRRLAILHELAHAKLDLRGKNSHDKELACDKWALRKMIDSGMYNLRELYNAISLFGEVINEPETTTHPSSKLRYRRLSKYLEECVS
jgi:hypothetical protein